MSEYLTNGTVLEDEDDDGEDYLKGEPTPSPNPGGRRVRAFVDLHSYGQLCESLSTSWLHNVRAWMSRLKSSHVPIRILL